MKALLRNKKIILLFFGLIVLIQYLILGGSALMRLTGWPSQELTVNYSFGFIRRGFIGSFITLISRLFPIDIHTIIVFTQLFGTIVFVGLLFFIFFYVMKKNDNASTIQIILLFLAMGSIGFYFADWGEMDIFMLSISLVSCLLIIKDKFIWLVPLLTAVCVMIHEGYVFMYFGIIVALLLYRAAMETNLEKKKKYWLCLFSTGFLAASLFIYFYFFSISISKNHIDEIIANAEHILNSQVYTNNLKYIYEGNTLPNSPMWVNRAPTHEFFIRMFAVMMNTLVCLPVISILNDFWKMVMKNTPDKKRRRLIALCLSCQMFTIPLVLMQTDQSRWFYDIVFFNFLFITSVLCIGSKEFSSAAETHMKPTIGKVILIAFYLVFFSNPNLQLISQHYQTAARITQEILSFLPT